MLNTDLQRKIYSRFEHLLNFEDYKDRKETIINKITQLNNNKSNFRDKAKFWHYGSSFTDSQSMEYWVYWVLEHKFHGLSLILRKIIYYEQSLALSGSSYYYEVDDFIDYWKDFTLSQLIKGSKLLSERDFLVKNQVLLMDLITFFCLLKLHDKKMELFGYKATNTIFLKPKDIDKLENLYFVEFLENKLDLFADIRLIQKIQQKFDVIRKRSRQKKFDLSFPRENISGLSEHRDFTYNQDDGKLGIVSEDAAAFVLGLHSEYKFSLRTEEVEFLLYKKKYMGEVTYLKGTHQCLRKIENYSWHDQSYSSLWPHYRTRKKRNYSFYDNC